MKPFCPFPLLIFIFFVFIFQARAEPSDTQIVAQPIVSKENVVISAPLKDGVAAMDSIGVVNPPLKDNKDSFRPIPFSAKYKITLDKSSHFDEGIDKVHGTLEMTIKETDKDDVCVWTT
ncbi:MAG: hypothetical protein NWQ29_02050, partial [Alphaproteobacteria bacterium]|nr:hypothetical protein [Alphaproteobacteria bacterium]